MISTLHKILTFQFQLNTTFFVIKLPCIFWRAGITLHYQTYSGKSPQNDMPTSKGDF